MGTTCCIKPPLKKHNPHVKQEEEIYVVGELPYPETDRDVALPTKRTSEPSLLPLNNEITNLINTFEKCHGTIGNSFTRSNTVLNSLSLVPKIKHHEQEISQIFFTNIKANGSSHKRNNTSQKFKTQFLPLIKQNRQSQAQRIERVEQVIKATQHQKENSQKQAQKQNEELNVTVREDASHVPKIRLKSESEKPIQFDMSSSVWEQENHQPDSFNNDEYDSNMLGDSIINESLCLEKMQLVNNYNTIEGTTFQPWTETNLQSFTIELNEIISSQSNPVINASLSAIAIYYETFKISLCAYRKIGNHSEVKLYINGHKRFMPLENAQNPTRLFQNALATLYQKSSIYTNPCNQVYHLSGWVPEVLYLNEIQNKNNLWDRLVENFNEGNILISFSTIEQNDTYLTLHSIDTLNNKLKLISNIRNTLDTDQNLAMCQFSWEQLLESIGDIYINWNPSIYNFSRKMDSKWITKMASFENQAICLENNPQYLIKIPRHSQDFEIRVFADRYIKQFSENKRLSLKLYEYDGSRILNPHEAIRTLQVDSRQLISDVFIFEKSDTVDYFVLVVMDDNDEPKLVEEEIGFSLLFLSFVDVEIKELPRREVLLSDSIISVTSKRNLGYGLNSPDFLHNLQYSIKVSPESFLQVLVESTDGCEFTLILVQDKNHQMDVARVDFETVLNQSVITQGFQKYGFVEKQTSSEHYILIIALNKSSAQSKFKITVNTLSKLFKRNKQLESLYSSISVDEIQFKPRIMKQIEMKWDLKSSGPRKRLKHTSTQVVYHPVSVFEEFLKNPHIVLKLEKGNYQFNLVCDNYRTQFYKSDHVEGEPPALCISVLKNSDNNKGYKIIVDDAFYVPIGYGFWTPELSLEEGRYTIICARVDQCNSKGRLRIRKL